MEAILEEMSGRMKKCLVVRHNLLLLILLLTGSNNLLNSALICHNLYFRANYKNPENSCKTGHSGRIKEKQNYDKSAFYLSWQCLMDAVKTLILKDFLGINQ